MVRVSGAMAYDTECDPVEVTWAKTNECTEEIPVFLPGGNTTLYVTPLTFVVQRYGSVKPCSAIQPVRWNIAGSWWCASPQVVKCESPQQLEAKTVKISNTSSLPGMGKHIYSDAQVAEHRIAMWHHEASKPIISLEATRAITTGAAGQFRSVLSSEDLKSAEKNILGYVLPYPLQGGSSRASSLWS